jgi:hypothetical protein
VVPKITITNQQQNDTQKAQDPRQLQSMHRIPHPFESTNNNHRAMSTRIDEYHAFTDKPGGVGTILFGKEIADINMEDISSDVNPTIKSRLNDDGVKDASQVQCFGCAIYQVVVYGFTNGLFLFDMVALFSLVYIYIYIATRKARSHGNINTNER